MQCCGWGLNMCPIPQDRSSPPQRPLPCPRLPHCTLHRSADVEVVRQGPVLPTTKFHKRCTAFAGSGVGALLLVSRPWRFSSSGEGTCTPEPGVRAMGELGEGGGGAATRAR